MDNLEKYYGKTTYSIDVLKMIMCDVREYGKPYDPNVTYAGRGSSRKWSLSEMLIPEFEYNEIFWLHDQMYTLYKLKITGYTKHLADELMYQLLKIENFKLAYIYYKSVCWFG